jgi:hypothetical protein
MPDQPSNRGQHEIIARALIDLGYATRAARLAELSRLAGREIGAFAALSFTEAADMIVTLADRKYNQKAGQ